MAGTVDHLPALWAAAPGGSNIVRQTGRTAKTGRVVQIALDGRGAGFSQRREAPQDWSFSA